MEEIKIDTKPDALLFRCLEGVANDAEYEEAWRWAHQSSENMLYYSSVRDVWMVAELLKPVSALRQQQVWATLEKKMQPVEARGKRVRMKYLSWTAAAAAIALAYILGVYTPNQNERKEVANSGYTIEAPKGGKSVMTLIDGSKVWLNAGSSVHVDRSFGKQNRTLTLSGEAYFEVARDPKRLFLVETSGITIAALGTAFNVKAYPEDDLIETTLVEGSVRIETNAHSTTQMNHIVLEPNQKATFYKNRHALTVHTDDTNVPLLEEPDALQSLPKMEVAKNVDVEASTSWKDKRWTVRSESLGAFAVKIERKYDVQLIFEDAELAAYKISATLEEETMEQLLNAIRHTVPMDYRIERDQVYLKINPQLKTQYDQLLHNNQPKP